MPWVARERGVCWPQLVRLLTRSYVAPQASYNKSSDHLHRNRTSAPTMSVLNHKVYVLLTAFAAVVRGAIATRPAVAVSPFAQKALTIVSSHPIVKSNPYTEWFARGEATIEQSRDLVQQFSVFSNLFLLAQLNKVINAPTMEEMREGKEILANEIGVVFKPKNQKRNGMSAGFDPSVVSTTGSVEGGVYSNRAAHFEWLCDVGHSLGMRFEDLGKRRLGSEATLHFCDKLFEIYGSEDLSVSLGASFAIEHWANAGFWDHLVDGFTKLNARPGPGVLLDDGTVSHTAPLGFWKFHQVLEAQHAEHTMDELEEAYACGRIADEANFEEAANAMLDACAVFWAGLDATRKGESYVLPASS